MFFALLFDGDDRLLAAAPAVDVVPFGIEYWSEIYPQKIPTAADCQEAIVEISDSGLVEQLKSLQSSDEFLPECRAAVQRLLTTRFGQSAAVQSPRNPPRAA